LLTVPVKEGVTRSLQGDAIGVIKWRDDGGVGRLLSTLFSSSAIETAHTGGRGDGPAGS